MLSSCPFLLEEDTVPSPDFKKSLLFVAILLCSIALTGCDNPLDGLSQMLSGESAEWRALAQVQAQGAIRAIPGERYLQIIDDLNGPDPVKRKEAQDFLLRLGHLDRDPNTNWYATATFGFDERAKLRADGFWAFSDSRAQVEYFVQNAFNPPDIASMNYRMETMDELNSKIDTNVDSFIDTLQGASASSLPVFGPTMLGSGTVTFLTWPNSLTPTIVNPPFETHPTALERAKGTRDAAAKTLKALFEVQFEKKEIPVGATTLTIPWHPEEGKNLFFLLIPESDWMAHQNDNNLSIEVTLHRENDLNDTFQKTSPFRVNLQQFKDREPVELGFEAGKVRWAVIDPTHTSATIPDLSPEKVRNMEQLLRLVNEVNAGTGNFEGTVAPRKGPVVLMAVIVAIFICLLSAIVYLAWELRKLGLKRT
jgi:hypothetical protein